MKMKQVLATGAALSMALSMAPVTASAADKVDINVIAAQYGQQTADWWANFVTEFNEANPDINLNVEVVSWNDIYTVVNTRIANGEAPDVLNIDVFADYQADDLLLPIQDVVSEETYSAAKRPCAAKVPPNPVKISSPTSASVCSPIPRSSPKTRRAARSASRAY